MVKLVDTLDSKFSRRKSVSVQVRPSALAFCERIYIMISSQISEFIQNSSWIRRMFEAGDEMRKSLGEENVFDFSLGNPCLKPPIEVVNAWIKHLQKKNSHSYTSNAGLWETREFIAQRLKCETSLDFTADLITLCCGAGGGLNVVLHSLLNSEEEVLVSRPYFPEYFFYAFNHSGVLKTVSSKQNFQLDLDSIEKSLSKKTKVFLINSPNNPTGVVYQKEDIQKLGLLLENYTQKNGTFIYLVSDEPYAKIIYDGVKNPSVFDCYQNSIRVTSHSKDLSLAGERIGYIALHPEIQEKEKLVEACGFSNRTLGFVNAPATMQAILPKIFDLALDLDYYLALRNLLYDRLTKIGYKMQKPQGAFYLFPESLEKDDLSFIKKALEFGILLVPGSGFGMPSHFRLSYAVDKSMAERSLCAFEELFNYYKKR